MKKAYLIAGAVILAAGMFELFRIVGTLATY